MLKTTFIAIFCFSSVLLNGQIEKPITKGNFSLGGGISISRYNNYQDDESTNHYSRLSFYPKFGYFILDGLEFGIYPQVSISNANDEHIQNDMIYNLKFTSKDKSRAVGLSPFVNYYFKSGVFCNFEIVYKYIFGISENYTTGFIHSDFENYAVDNYTKINFKQNKVGFSIGTGYAYFINSKVALETAISYTKLFTTFNNKITTEDSNNVPTEDKIKSNSGEFGVSIGFKLFL